jgi:hypothetical protein
MPMSCLRTLTLSALIAALSSSAASCKRESSNYSQEPAYPPSAASTQAPTAAPVADFGPEPYPRARWRLAALTELENVVLWASHVLIRHEEVGNSTASFQLAGWELDLPPARRSRREALELAERIASDARTHGNFAELARQFSDDLSTRDDGGSLAGITGAHIWPWPTVLDALATLKPGDVSRVVETQYGFHVFRSNPTPPETMVTGSHIVIAHNRAPGLDAVARGQVPSRSRAEALALAAQVYELARAAPGDFAKLAEQYSDHADAARGGDFGTWSTHEPTGLYREVDMLSRLAIGQVAPPLDTPYGLQIFVRTPNRPRKEYAMVKLQLRFDPALPDTESGSRASVFAKAREVSALLRAAPNRFGALQAQHCCTRPMRVVAGRSLPALEAALERLKPGQIASEPIADPVEYMIPKRLELDVLPEIPAARFELPNPSQPDLRYMLSRAPSLGKELTTAAKQAALELLLPEQVSAKLLQQQTVPADFEQQALEARLQVLSRMDTELTALLEAQTLQRYRALVHRHFERLILRGDGDGD